MTMSRGIGAIHRRTRGLIALAGALVTLTATGAQGPAAVEFTIGEPAGIRRTEYPVSATIAWPRGAVSDTARLRLRAGDEAVMAQFTTVSRWDDGSLRQVDVDFNQSLAAGEQRRLRVTAATDAAAAAPAPPRSALSVHEDAAHVTVGSVRLGRRAWPLLASVGYRGEIIRDGANGLSVIDSAGAPRPFGAAGEIQVDVVKAGPLLVVIRYHGRVTLGDGTVVPVTLTCELPNSKTWIRVTAEVLDPDRRVHGLRFDTPFALGAYPWTWDFGTDNATYGAFRTGAERAVLTQRRGTAAPGWQVETGTGEQLRVVERSLAGSARVAGWGHLLDARNAIALAVDRFGSDPGSHVVALTGSGQATIDLRPTRRAARHRLVVYEHFVSTPVAIGAATSPAAMLRPLTVIVPK